MSTTYTNNGYSSYSELTFTIFMTIFLFVFMFVDLGMFPKSVFKMENNKIVKDKIYLFGVDK